MNPSSGILIPSRAFMFQRSISALMLVPFVMAFRVSCGTCAYEYGKTRLD